MPALRRSKYLTCFYCGRRTSTLNNGRVRHFECPNCEATNYLDENGEITDPPVHATTAPLPEEPTTYAIPRARTSPRAAAGAGAGAGGETSGDVFCSTCLKNQQLFTRSLAQYLPDDPDAPEYEERERGYYAYRKGLERHYPQVCADCEPKALERITQAGYTAKTDHLRRMIDRSREVRTSSGNGLLGLVSGLGRLLWVLGFVLQALWHVSLMCLLLSQHDAIELGEKGAFWGSQYLLPLATWVLAVLPSPERLVKWSVWAAVASLWWNPYFIKTFRGFTKHLVGLRAWYTYQPIIIFLRVIAQWIPRLESLEGPETSLPLAAHAFMLIFTLCVYKLALASIRTDSTPLFASTPKGSSSLREAPSKPREGDATSMSDILDEVLASSATNTQNALLAMTPRSDDETPVPRKKYASRVTNQNPFPSSQPSSVFGAPSPRASLSTIDSLSLSEHQQQSQEQQKQQNIQYDMEMDWQPTQSKHRAFNTFGAPQMPLRGFGQAPVTAEDNEQRRQFWYKIPPAPTSIARRALNPPQAVRLRKQAPLAGAADEKKGMAIFSKEEKEGGGGFGRQQQLNGRNDVAFKEPSFFHQENGNDPRNSLSDMFGKAFTISPSQESKASGRRRGGTRSSGTRAGEGSAGSSGPVSFWDLALLAVSVLLLFSRSVAFASWPERSSQLALGVCGVSLVIWAVVVIDSVASSGSSRSTSTSTSNPVSSGGGGRRPKPWTALVGQLLVVAELVLSVRIGVYAWVTGKLEGVACLELGSWFIGALVVHQVWRVLLKTLIHDGGRLEEQVPHGGGVHA